MALLVLAACGRDEQGVRSVLRGDVRLRADVDSTLTDQSGFEVLVADRQEGRFDTLGFATTDRAGAFEMTITAPERGVYPLLISRGGPTLSVDELVVAEGDTARLQAELPTERRQLRIRSLENDAWGAYQNTKAQHNQSLLQTLQTSAADSADSTAGASRTTSAMTQRVEQTSAILWSIRESFPGTFAADLASAEAVMMLDAWNDSLLIARSEEIQATNPNFVGVARALRRARARRDGQAAAIGVLQQALEEVDDREAKAALRAEIVRAHMDSLEVEAAQAEAQVLQAEYPGTAWARWAGRTIYELEHLMPGMEAPALAVTTTEGEWVNLDSLRGQTVVLEFYRPTDPTFQQELGLRRTLFEAARAEQKPFTLLSISLEPDTLVNEALLEGRNIPGRHVFTPDGLEDPLAQAYNVSVLPSRYLIGPRGTLEGKYFGGAMPALYEDALVLLGLVDPDAATPADSVTAANDIVE